MEDNTPPFQTALNRFFTIPFWGSVITSIQVAQYDIWTQVNSRLVIFGISFG